MRDVYIPVTDYNSFNYYYFSRDLKLIFATNDNITATVFDTTNHYLTVDNYPIDSVDSLVPISRENLTNNWFYRNDTPDISILVVIFSVFFFYIPIKIFSKLFKRGGF